MAELMQASNQWRNRPADERYLSLDLMKQRAMFLKAHSAGKVIDTKSIEVVPVGETGIGVKGPAGNVIVPTHWAFGQLGTLASAPVGWCRESNAPAALVADVMNWGLRNRPSERIGVLLRQENGTPEITAATGDTYGRIWNADILDAMAKEYGDGVTGHFRVPGEFGKRVEITKDNTTLFMGDRDMFVFLADEDRRIEIPNRRAGRMGTFARGFFVRNSEVGAGLAEITSFFFDYVCCNRIVWGATDVQSIKIRHSSGAPSRWIHEAAPALRRYTESSTKSLTDAIDAVRKERLGPVDKVKEFLATRKFTKSQVNGILAAHMEVELRPIETRWDVVVGITEYAKKVEWQDERVRLEREAGKLMVA